MVRYLKVFDLHKIIVMGVVLSLCHRRRGLWRANVRERHSDGGWFSFVVGLKIGMKTDVF